MNPKDKKIIEKLLSLAEKQQKILTKLAQAAQEDIEGNKAYLASAWQTAGANMGVPTSNPTVEYKEPEPGSDPGVTLGSSYVVTGPIPANARNKFVTTFKAQISAQKPELDGKVSTIFTGP